MRISDQHIQIRLPTPFKTQVKSAAAARGMTITGFILEAVKDAMKREPERPDGRTGDMPSRPALREATQQG